jgi:hypothetical protein
MRQANPPDPDLGTMEHTVVLGTIWGTLKRVRVSYLRGEFEFEFESESE